MAAAIKATPKAINVRSRLSTRSFYLIPRMAPGFLEDGTPGYGGQLSLCWIANVRYRPALEPSV
jgi:hypothetical protein